MRGAVVLDGEPGSALAAVLGEPSMAGAALARLVSTRQPYVYCEGRVRVAVVDYGAKRSILRRLAAAGAAVTVFPHDVDAGTLARIRRRRALERPRRPGTARRRGGDAA